MSTRRALTLPNPTSSHRSEATPAARTLTGSRAYPEFPSLWPHMLLRKGDAMDQFPFCAPGVQYFYFARIAVWRAAQHFGLEGREVLVPAYHHGVEIGALVAAGVRPVFYPVGPKWEVCPEDVARLVTKRTGAIYLTHFAGFPGPVEALRGVAAQHGLPLIEDCALSLFSQDGRVPLGSVGDASIFCLYKTLPVPNGGALVLNNPAAMLDEDGKLDDPSLPTVSGQVLSALLRNLELRGGGAGRTLTQQARRIVRRIVRGAKVERVAVGSDHFDPEHTGIGMSDFSKRVLAAQRPDRIRDVRRRNYRILGEELDGVATPLLTTLPDGVCPLFFPVVVENKVRVVRELRRRGVGAVDFWRHSHPACELGRFPDVARLRATVVELPCHQDLSPRWVREMAGTAREVLRQL
jgi:perosamine synthetase